VKLLLDRGADVTTTNKDGWTPVNTASNNGHAEVVRLLLASGADFKTATNIGSTSLYSAADNGHLEVVKILLESGADTNAQGGKYGNALQAASYRGHTEVIQLLLDKGADVNAQGGKYGYALFAALAGNHHDIAVLLSEKDFRYSDIQQDLLGRSRMLSAACYGYLSGLEQDLASGGASVDTVDNHQWTALHWAAYFAQTAVINLLLQNGADSTKRDWQGWSACDVAVFVGNDIPVLRVEGAGTLSDVSPGVHIRGACDICGHVSGDLLWNRF
jgi:ankyrin repeat protein